MLIIVSAVLVTAIIFALAIFIGNTIAKFLTKKIGTPAEDLYNKYIKLWVS